MDSRLKTAAVTAGAAIELALEQHPLPPATPAAADDAAPTAPAPADADPAHHTGDPRVLAPNPDAFDLTAAELANEVGKETEYSRWFNDDRPTPGRLAAMVACLLAVGFIRVMVPGTAGRLVAAAVAFAGALAAVPIVNAHKRRSLSHGPKYRRYQRAHFHYRLATAGDAAGDMATEPSPESPDALQRAGRMAARQLEAGGLRDIALAFVSPDHRLRWVSPAFCALLGRSAPALCNMTFEQITHPEDVDLDAHLAERLFAGSLECYEMDKRYLTAEGATVPIRLLGSPLRDSEGKVRFAVALIEKRPAASASPPASPSATPNRFEPASTDRAPLRGAA